jgi:hypothetical protein
MASIKRPGVEVTQENVTATPIVSAPALTTVLVGPCYQIVDAFDDSGVAQADALAGTYQDGKGTIAYALPGLKTGGIVTASSVRAFRVDGAGASVELRDSDNEETIVSGTNGTYSESSTTFADASAGFVASGVTKGDFVRVTYQGESIDIEITAAVVAATSLTVDTPIAYTGALTFSSYSIVRNPPQFLYKAAAEQADVEFPLSASPETNYLHIAVKSTAASTLVGSAGDGFKMQLKETDPDYSIAYAATGNAVYAGTNIGDNFGTLNDGSVGPAAVTTLAAGGFVLIAKAGATPVGQPMASAVSDHSVAGGAGATTAGFVALVSGTALGSSPQGVLGKITARTATTGSSTVYTHSSTTVTFTAHGLSTADDAGGTGLNFVYIDNGTNAGLYPVTSSSDANALVIGTTNPGSDLAFTGASGQQLLALKVASATPVALTVGDLTSVYDYSATSTLQAVLGTSHSGTKSIVFGSDAMASAQYKAISGLSGRVVTVAALSAGASGKQALAVATTASMNFVEPSGSSVTYQIELPRVSGESTIAVGTLASTLDSDSTFSGNFDATSQGSGNVTYAEVATADFDGGVDADNILVDADLIGSTSATHSLYVSYSALRVDVSDQASSPALTDITSTTDVTTNLGVISTDNPLALAAYFGTLQSPSTTLKCLGVSATSTTEPSGTTAAYTSALEYLEGHDVYSVVCLSTDPTIQALFETHVDNMSAPTNKSERIAWVSQGMPTHTTATVLSSGTSGDTGADFATDGVFATNVDFALNAALATVLADTASDDLILVVTAKSASTAAPTVANGVIPARYGVRVDKSATTTQHASDSTKLKILVADAGAAAALDGTWGNAVAVTWSLYQMGTALSTTAEKATAVADLGAQFSNKRVFLTWPNSATASISGTATVIGGEYLAAAWGAKVGFEKPEAPFTNTSITGFSGVSGSSNLFSRSQLDEIAGGGTWITVQDSPASPLSCRHQLATLTTTISDRELSITKTVDYVAKRLRQVLEPKIGSFRITQSYLDTLGIICEGELRNFVESGVLSSGKVNFVEVDSTESDQVNIQIIISVPTPGNYIALTLQF